MRVCAARLTAAMVVGVGWESQFCCVAKDLIDGQLPMHHVFLRHHSIRLHSAPYAPWMS
jgi:hypothetical protein